VVRNANQDVTANLQVRDIAVEQVAGQPPAVIEFDSPWDANVDLSKLQVGTDTATKQMILVHPKVAPYRLQEGVLETYTFELFPFTATPPSWKDDNWPSVIELFQGRLILANTGLNPSTIWMSAVNDFTDMVKGEAADEPLEFELNTNGTIEWIRGNKVLLIGTDRSEWTATGSAGVITNNDFKFQEQSRLGSVADIVPQYISDQIAFVGLDSRRIRVINYDADVTDTWASQEITLQADQLFENRILDMAYARDPDYQLAVLTDDGQLKICMHDRITGLTGWYTYSTKGRYMSVEYSNDPTGSSIWVIAERVDANNDFVYTIERFDAGSVFNVHLDAYVAAQAYIVEDEAGAGAFSSAFSSEQVTA